MLFSITIGVSGEETLALKEEPTFEGKTVSFWIDHLPFTDVFSRTGLDTSRGFPERSQTLEQAEAHQKAIKPFRKAAPKAISEIGTNAVPYLMQRLQMPDLPGNELPYEKDLAADVDREVSGRVIRGQAVVGFESLLPHRALIEPPLIKLLRNLTLPQEIRAAACASLRRIAPDRAEQYQRELRESIP